MYVQILCFTLLPFATLRLHITAISEQASISTTIHQELLGIETEWCKEIRKSHSVLSTLELTTQCQAHIPLPGARCCRCFSQPHHFGFSIALCIVVQVSPWMCLHPFPFGSGRIPHGSSILPALSFVSDRARMASPRDVQIFWGQGLR